MIKTTPLLLWLCLLAVCGSGRVLAASDLPILDIQAMQNEASFDETKGLVVVSNGVCVTYTETNSVTILTARTAGINRVTGDIFAQGDVHIQHDDQTWVGEELHYNYLKSTVGGEKFRLGQNTVFVGGDGLGGKGKGTNAIYQGTNGIITTDDYSDPSQKVRAKRFTIVPNHYVEAHDATLYVGKVPVFYFPYYRHSLVQSPNHFTFLPGYRSIYGPYILSGYDWYWDQHLQGAIHFDYREARGFGGGPDLKYDYGSLGEGTFRYYYARDHKPGTNIDGSAIARDRDLVNFTYSSTPSTNLTILSQVAWQKDQYVVRDFYESQYKRDIQPATYLDANQYWQNWSLDAIAQPRVNPYWDTVERLPDVRLTGFRQQIDGTPLYYESQSSLGYFRRRFSDTNNSPSNYFASRFDSFHQITLPQNYFGWLNFTPRVGGRLTLYDSATGPGAYSTSQSRGVFNTGAEVSTTISRVWAGEQNAFWDVDGIRHIFQPSVNYVFVPRPNIDPSKLPQFDYELTNSLRLLPLEYPDYNSIDSLRSQNTIRYGANNRIQTKRNGEIEDLVNWGLYMDWNLRTRPDQRTLSDIYSDLSLRPRTWLILGSTTRYNIDQGQFNLAEHHVTLQPNNTWNWSLGHTYLRSGTIFGTGDNLFSSVYFYRLNENWGTRLAHYFDANSGRLQEQDYTFYRDMRSWTAALTLRALSNVGKAVDYGVAFSFSFKSFPRYGLGADTVHSAELLGN